MIMLANEAKRFDRNTNQHRLNAEEFKSILAEGRQNWTTVLIHLISIKQVEIE